MPISFDVDVPVAPPVVAGAALYTDSGSFFEETTGFEAKNRADWVTFKTFHKEKSQEKRTWNLVSTLQLSKKLFWNLVKKKKAPGVFAQLFKNYLNSRMMNKASSI